MTSYFVVIQCFVCFCILMCRLTNCAISNVRSRLAAEIDAMMLPVLPPPSPQSPLPPSSTFWSVISSDASPTYAFPLPFVAHAWSKIVGARPLVVLVGSEFSRHARSSWISVLLSQLRSLSIKFIIVDPTPSSPATFSQLVRLFAFKLSDILPHDYVVASDRYSV